MSQATFDRPIEAARQRLEISKCADESSEQTLLFVLLYVAHGRCSRSLLTSPRDKESAP